MNGDNAVTAPRIIVAGATTALTRRTTLRKAFLGGWHPLVADCWLYALADAQRQTNIAVHHSTLVVNHHHTTVTPTASNLPEFVRRFHRDFSCALHALLCAVRYDAPRELFDDRPAHMMRLLDPASQASHLVYERLNPVAAGLVDRPADMPHRTLDFGLWKTGYVEVARPPVYFSSSRPARLRLRLTPPPLLYQAFGGDLARLVHHLERLIEYGARTLCRARSRPAMGARAVQRLHPWSEPRTMREPGGGRVPSFRIGARDSGASEQRRDAAREVRAFRGRHDELRIARREGDNVGRFPFGTYAMRVHHGAPTELEPPAGAQVARPGPVLDDLRNGAGQPPPVGGVHGITDAVREDLDTRSGRIPDDAGLDFAKIQPDAETRTGRLETPSQDETTLPDRSRIIAVVRQLVDQRANTTPSRIVTFRDRRGRTAPPRPRGPDPPQ